MKKSVSLALALLWSVSLWGEDTSGDLEESLTTTDERVAVYDAKDGSGDKVMHFTDTSAPQDFIVNEECTVRLLMVGGGGAGGYQRGGGGGAGGLIIKDEYVLQPGTYTVTVGAGGSALTKVQGNSDKAEALGKSTILKRENVDLLTAGGGGFGGYRSGNNAGTTGTTPNGGSGGGVGAGCGADSAAVSSVDGSLVNCGGLSNLAPTSSTLTNWRTRTGYDDEVTATGDNGAAGGGGAGSAGHCGYNNSDGKLAVNEFDSPRTYGKRRGGNGGDGVESDITGERLYYAAGGGGAVYLSSTGGLRGLGGSGVGGNGAGFIETADIDAEFAPATAGLAGTGSGGGGGPWTDSGKNWARANGNYVAASASTAFAEYAGSDKTYQDVSNYTASAFYSGAGGSGALILRWTSADPEVAKRPRLRLDACTDNGDATATIPLEVTGLGVGATTATVSVRWGVDEAMTDGTANLEVTANGAYELTLTNLIPGYTYFYEVTASNDVGGLLEIPSSAFDVAASSAWPQTYPVDLPVIGSAAFEQTGIDGLTLRVCGSLKNAVEGQQVTLFYSTDANATSETMTRLPIADPGLDGLDFAFAVDGLLAEGETLYGYLEISATVDRTRTARSARTSITPVTAAQLGSLNSGAKEIGAGYDEENAIVTIAVPMTPGYGDNIAKIYFIPGTRPWETGFDEEKAILVKTVDHAETAINDGVFKTMVAKADCPETISWDKSYYYWVVVSSGDPEAPFVAQPTVAEGKTENCFAYADYSGQGVLSGILPASTYIQDGLISLWDGIENVGPGLPHDPTTKNWIDHKNGNNKFVLKANERFTGRFYCVTNSDRAATVKIAAEPLTTATLESYAVPASPLTSTKNDWINQITRVDTVGNINFDARLGGISAAFFENDFPTDDSSQSSRLRSFDSGFESATKILDAGIFQTYSAALATGFCRVSVNGEKRNQTEGIDPSKVSISRKSNASSWLRIGSGTVAMKMGSLRVYNRNLSEAETFHNHKVDLARFEDDADWVRRNGEKLQYCIRVTCDARLGAVSVNDGEPQSGTIELWVDEDGADMTLTLTTTERVREFRGWKGANISDEAAQEMSITVSPMIMDIRPVFRSNKTHYIPTDFPDINTAVAADDVLDGDTLYLEDGTHRFNQVKATCLIHNSGGKMVTNEMTHCGIVRRPLTLTGSSAEKVILDCAGFSGLLVDDPDAFVSNLALENFSMIEPHSSALIMPNGTVSNIVVNGGNVEAKHEARSIALYFGSGAVVTDTLISGIKHKIDWVDHYFMLCYGTLFQRVTFRDNKAMDMIEVAPGDTGLRTRFENCIWDKQLCANHPALCVGKDVDFEDCVLANATGENSVGGFTVKGLWTMNRCVVTNNTSLENGKLFSFADSTKQSEGAVLAVTNSLIVGNKSAKYGVVHLGKWSTAEFVNSTIANNVTTLGDNAAFVTGDGGLNNSAVCPATVRLVNSIVWNNTAGTEVKELLDSYAYTIFEPSFSCLSPGTALEGEGLKDGNPDFVDPSAGDFHLGHSSSCIDTGLSIAAVAADMDGVVRPIDGTGDGNAFWDIGCYEAPVPEIPLQTTVILHDEEGLAPTSPGVSVMVTGTQLTGLTYEWWSIRKMGEKAETNIFSNVFADYTFENLPIGTYTFVSVVRNDQGYVVTNVSDKAFLSLTDTAYVSTTGAAVWPYATPETAARSLMDAIPVAKTVRVLPGTYSFDHFVDEATERECQALVNRGAIIEGAADPEGVTIDCAGKGGFILNHVDASLSGMTFVNSQLEADSGRTLDVQAGTVSNVVIRGAGAEAPACPIPFLYIGENGRATRVAISNCTVTAQASDMGLVYMYGGTFEDFTLTDCTSRNSLMNTMKSTSGTRSRIANGLVSNNTHSAAGLRFLFSDVQDLEVCDNASVNKANSLVLLQGSTAERCRILRNSCLAAVYSSTLWGNDEAILRNSLVMNNQTKTRPALDSVDGSTHTTVENCTIVFNAAESGPAGGVACNVSSEHNTHLNMVNSIVWGNTVAGEPNDAGECRETCNYSYSCFREAADYPEAHNIAVDPKVRAETGRPSLLTPCRDIGLALPWHATGVDLEGGVRVLGAGVDLGCFEVKDGGMIIFVR